MAKSRDAFRTISEVADWLGTQPHVLRFWESKFSQVKPVKRAGGRRYYRPADMQLLGGIKQLLHEDGLTIKGAQKVLREQGVKYVSSLSPEVKDDEDAPSVVAAAVARKVEAEAPKVVPLPEAAPKAPAPVETKSVSKDTKPLHLRALGGRLKAKREVTVGQILPLLDRLRALETRLSS
ncbi:MAG: MerR family transcriptional regulator [Pseudomonadota bacterium]